MRIVIADDHAVMRAGIRSLLEKQPGITVVGEAATATELVQRVDESAPDVVIADLRMPGEGVLDAVRTVRATHPETQVVIFSAFDEPADAYDALGAGAAGYVLKQSPPLDLVTAVTRASQGKRFVDAALAARVLEERPDLVTGGARSAGTDTPLSERETQVLELVARGFTGPQIATELGIQVGTVETLRHRIRKKLGLKTRADLMRFARSARFTRRK